MYNVPSNGLCLSLFVVSIVPDLISAACPSPDTPEDVFALSTRGLYETGDVFDVVCVPGNRPEEVFQLRCDTKGHWQGDWPNCSERENKARWWMLLLGIVSIIVIIPCTLPRIYFAYFDSSEQLKSPDNRRSRHSSSPGKRFEMQELPDLPRKDNVNSYDVSQLYATPLPLQKRPKQYVAANNYHDKIRF